tara:strand:+ start:223 stop:519 length:297 start_codon:yes stop_codon:yes gene_type:complete
MEPIISLSQPNDNRHTLAENIAKVVLDYDDSGTLGRIEQVRRSAKTDRVLGFQSKVPSDTRGCQRGKLGRIVQSLQRFHDAFEGFVRPAYRNVSTGFS